MVNELLTFLITRCRGQIPDFGDIKIMHGNQNALAHGAGAGLDTSQSGFIDYSELLDAADVGLAIFDADLNLIKTNFRYCELCGYVLSQVSPGTPLRDLIRTSLEKQSMGAQSDRRIRLLSEAELRVSHIRNNLLMKHNWSYQLVNIM